MLDTVSEAFKNTAINGTGLLTSRLVFDDLNITVTGNDIFEIKDNYNTCDSNIGLGSTYIPNVIIKITKNTARIKGKVFRWEVGISQDNGKTYEYCLMRTFYVRNVKNTGDTTTIEAASRFYLADMVYVPSSLTMSNFDMISEIENAINMKIDTHGLTERRFLAPTGKTYREVIGAIFALDGYFAWINREDTTIYPKWYTDSGIIISDGFSEPTIEDEDVTVEKVYATLPDKTLLTDGSGYGIDVTNIFLTQNIFNELVSKLKGFTYRISNLCLMAGNPLLDAYDIVTIEYSGELYKIPLCQISHNYNGGYSTTIRSVGKTDGDNSNDNYKSPVTKALENLTAELIVTNNLLAAKATIEDLTATNAEIKNLRAEYLEADQAIFADLTAAKGKIDELESKQITTDYLDANYATIANLDAVNAKFNTYDSVFGFTENSQIINLTAANVTIDDSVVFDMIAKRITVADLLTARAQAEKFDIITDGAASVSFKGATQQFYDSNGNVRVQIGQAKNGDFNFLVVGSDGKTTLFNENGITENAIADGLIVDDMVAENANIQGGKIDMQSLFESMNNSVYTLTSSKVLYDDSGQTLQVAFNKLTTDVRTIATNAENAAQSVVDRADSGEFKGEKGDKGDTGATGNGIKTVTRYYLATSASSGVTTGTTGWTTSLQFPSTDKRYLWIYDITEYTNGNVVTSQPAVFGVYGEKGAQGPKGDKGDTGTAGAKGTDGVSVRGVEALYYLSTSATTQTGGSWSTTVPAWADGKYMWTKTRTVFSNGTALETDPVCITGAKGATGATGAQGPKGATGAAGAQGPKGETGATGATGPKGDTGKGVKSIVPQYYLSTSVTAQTGGNWSNTCPKWEIGKYIWTRNAVTWTDNTTTYTTAVLANDINSIAETVTDQGTTLTQLNGQITAKIWQSDISTAVNGAVVEMNSKYSTVEQNLSDITMTVSSMHDDLDTTNASVSKLTQDMTGFKTTVSNTYTKKSDFDDITERMSAAESNITQNADEIALKVNKNGIISAINQTAESVKINASRINLSGYVMVSAYDADMDSIHSSIGGINSSITDAMVTANSAKTTADAAYSWTNTNGTNMTNLRNMVLKWTNNAVSTSTYIQGGWIATNTITAEKIAVGLSGNIMLYGLDYFPTPDSISRITDYTPSATTLTYNAITGNHRYGNYSIAFTTPSTLTASTTCYYSLYGTNIPNCGMVPVTAGNYYIFSFYVKQSTSSSIKIRARILSRSAPNASSSPTTVYGTQKTITVGTSWVRYSSQPMKLPNGWAQCSVDLTGTSGAHTLYFDCFQLEEVSSSDSTLTASPWKPQAATLIDGGNILTGTVTADSIAANAITANKIAAKAITSDKINVTALEAIAAKIGGFTIDSNALYTTSTGYTDIELNNKFLGVLYNSSRPSNQTITGYRFRLEGINSTSPGMQTAMSVHYGGMLWIRSMTTSGGVMRNLALFTGDGPASASGGNTSYGNGKYITFFEQTYFPKGLIGTVTSSSDERVKTDIRPISDKYIALFDSLEPKTFRYNRDPAKVHTGFIAQDLLRAISAVGLTTNDVAAFDGDNPNEYGIQYIDLIAIQAAKIKQLEYRIKNLEMRYAV